MTYEEARNYIKLRVPSLDRGMYPAFPVNVLPQEDGITRQLYDLNFSDVTGLVTKRPGIERTLPELPGKVKGATMFMQQGRIETWVVAYDDKVAYSTGGEWKEIQPPLWKDGATHCEFVSLGGMLVVSDGVNTPFRWEKEGEDIVILEDMPKFTIMTEHRGRIWGAGLEDDPLMLHASHPGDPSLWQYDEEGSRAFFTMVGTDSRITALRKLEDTLIIGKTDSIHVLAGATQNDFIVYPIDEQIGIAGQQSSSVMRGVIYFVAIDGEIYSMGVDARPMRISTPVKDILEYVDLSRLGEAKAAVFNKFDWVITLPLVAEPITLVYDILERRWREWSCHMGVAMRTFEAPGYLFTKPDGSAFFKFNLKSVNDEGTIPISGYVETMEYHFDEPEVEKEVRNLWVGTMVTDREYRIWVEARADSGSWVMLTPEGVRVEGKPGEYFRVLVPVQKLCRHIQFRISNDRKDQQMKLLDLVITFFPKELE